MTYINKLKAALPTFSAKASVINLDSVDSIIAPLKQQVNDLDTLISNSYQREHELFLEREELRSKIEGINAKIEALGTERSRAYAVKGNILAVIEG